MVFTTYSGNNNAKQFTIWMRSAEGDFEAVYRDRAGFKDEEGNVCNAAFEYEGAPMTGTLIMSFGTMFTSPQRQGLGSLLLFHAANYGVSRGAKEMRVVDNHNQEAWNRIMPLAVTVPNRPHDEPLDRRVDMRKFRDHCRLTAAGKGWSVHQPNREDIVLDIPAHLLALKAPLA